MFGQKADIGKMVALKEAGWRTEKIAAEMNMEPEKVDREIQEYLEARDKEVGDVNEKVERKGGILLVSLTSDQLKDIYEKAAAIGAKEAIKTFEQERKKEHSQRVDRRLRNTKLLLRNYHMLKEHAENSVFGRAQMEESALDILESMMSLYDDEVIIESIKRSATRTSVIVSHIETMFELYKGYCERSSRRDIELRRYEAVWDMYMSNELLSTGEIAKKLKISTRSVYDDIKIATERLTALFFGVDGLNVH